MVCKTLLYFFDTKNVQKPQCIYICILLKPKRRAEHPLFTHFASCTFRKGRGYPTENCMGSSLALQAERLISKISPAPPSTPFLAQDTILWAGSLQVIHGTYTHNFASSRGAAWPGLGIFGRVLSCASENWLQWEYFGWTMMPAVSMYPGHVLTGFFAYKNHVHQQQWPVRGIPHNWAWVQCSLLLSRLFSFPADQKAISRTPSHLSRPLGFWLCTNYGSSSPFLSFVASFLASFLWVASRWSC